MKVSIIKVLAYVYVCLVGVMSIMSFFYDPGHYEKLIVVGVTLLVINNILKSD